MRLKSIPVPQDSDGDAEEEEEESGRGWRDCPAPSARPAKLFVPPRRDSSPSVRSAAESVRSAESFPPGWTDEDNSPQVGLGLRTRTKELKNTNP